MKIGDLVQLNEAGRKIWPRREYHTWVVLIIAHVQDGPGFKWKVLHNDTERAIPGCNEKYWEVVSE